MFAVRAVADAPAVSLISKKKKAMFWILGRQTEQQKTRNTGREDRVVHTHREQDSRREGAREGENR